MSFVVYRRAPRAHPLFAPNADATQTIGVLLYKESIGSTYGYGQSAATGMVLTLVVMILLFIYMKLPTKGEE